MSSLYPSLEDMKVDQMMKAQTLHNRYIGSEPKSCPSAPYPTLSANRSEGNYNEALYPTLDNWMGLCLTSQEVAVIQNNSNALSVGQNTISLANNSMIAPLSSTSVGLIRANVTHGIREVLICKGSDGKVGLRARDINKGVFIVFIQNNSPAAMVGLRFGDQILQINGLNVAGFTTDKVHDIIKKASINDIRLVIRDRPFERVITLHKDSTGHIGFTFKNGKITAIVKDSSAARNGLLIEHNFLEINGQNVVGVDDKLVRKILESGGDIITLTIMPSFVFEHMMKQMASSLVKKLMDHSIPDV